MVVGGAEVVDESVVDGDVADAVVVVAMEDGELTEVSGGCTALDAVVPASPQAPMTRTSPASTVFLSMKGGYAEISRNPQSPIAPLQCCVE